MLDSQQVHGGWQLRTVQAGDGRLYPFTLNDKIDLNSIVSVSKDVHNSKNCFEIRSCCVFNNGYYIYYTF